MKNYVLLICVSLALALFVFVSVFGLGNYASALSNKITLNSYTQYVCKITQNKVIPDEYNEQILGYVFFTLAIDKMPSQDYVYRTVIGQVSEAYNVDLGASQLNVTFPIGTTKDCWVQLNQTLPSCTYVHEGTCSCSRDVSIIVMLWTVDNINEDISKYYSTATICFCIVISELFVLVILCIVGFLRIGNNVYHNHVIRLAPVTEISIHKSEIESQSTSHVMD